MTERSGALAADLPAVWHAATTTPAERQRVARLLLERVTVTVDKTSERVDVELHWVGGLVRRHTLSRPVKRYDLQSDYPRLVERLRALCAERAQRGVDRRAAQRRGLPAAEASGSVHGLDGPAADLASGPDAAAAARQPCAAWVATSTGRRVWPAAGDLTGHGEAVAARRLADGSPRCRWSPCDLGRCQRAAAARRTPSIATDLGEQRPVGRIEEAETPSGAVD